MSKVLTMLFCSILFQAEALEYNQLFENDQVCIAQVKVFPHEEIGLHRDVYPAVVVALTGGVITRLEADGRVTDVHFPTDVAVFRAADPENELHRSVNRSDDPIELMIIQLKKDHHHGK